MSNKVTDSWMMSHLKILNQNFCKITGRYLFDESKSFDQIKSEIDWAPFCLLSHNTDDDPKINYINQTALNLWGYSFDEVIGLPSRFTAEEVERSEREKLLQEVQEKGYIDHYEGIRIAKNGDRFLIKEALVFNLYHEDHYYGQAAVFEKWKGLPPVIPNRVKRA